MEGGSWFRLGTWVLLSGCLLKQETFRKKDSSSKLEKEREEGRGERKKENGDFRGGLGEKKRKREEKKVIVKINM